MRRVVVGDPFPGVMSGPARPAACPRAGWAASNRWARPSPAAIRSAATPPAASRRRPGLPQRQPLVDRRGNVLFFGLNTGVLAILLWAVTVAATLTGLVIGRRVARSATGLSEHFGVLQGALIGFMGLVLAFGLSLALGRYESRRADTVDEANAIGTAYLRAQTLAEPVRTETLDLFPRYTETSIAIAEATPGSAAARRARALSAEDQRRLWARAGQSLDQAPAPSAPRLYVESLNEAFDAQSTRVYALANRVPTAVLLVEVAGAAVALGALALHLSLHLSTLRRGLAATVVAALLVTVLLVVTFDLDRPSRGLIRVPATPLVDVYRSMSAPPAADGPG